VRLFALLEQLASLGCEVAADDGGGIKLRSRSESIPKEAIDLAKPHRDQLLSIVNRSTGLPPCSYCSGPLLAVPTLDGYENFECFTCGQCSGCRPGTARSKQ
jgi:hypothetical protein